MQIEAEVTYNTLKESFNYVKEQLETIPKVEGACIQAAYEDFLRKSSSYTRALQRGVKRRIGVRRAAIKWYGTTAYASKLVLDLMLLHNVGDRPMEFYKKLLIVDSNISPAELEALSLLLSEESLDVGIVKVNRMGVLILSIAQDKFFLENKKSLEEFLVTIKKELK